MITDPGMQLLKSKGMIPVAARALGITRSAVHQWARVPAEYLPKIEEATGIKRHELRPDICAPPMSAEVA